MALYVILDKFSKIFVKLFVIVLPSKIPLHIIPCLKLTLDGAVKQSLAFLLFEKYVFYFLNNKNGKKTTQYLEIAINTKILIF